LNQVWIDRLTPLAANYDTAALLSVHLIVAKRFEEAARVAVNIAQSTKLGWWNQIYVTILRGLARPSVIAKLKRQTQVEVLNSLGTCLAEAGQFSEAMARFEDLRRRSVRYRNSWGVGQSWINAGVAAARSGDNKAAEQLYSLAAAHGRRTRDPQLRGRALNNLSQLYMGTDIDLAEELLEASIRAKITAKDASGLVAGLAVRVTNCASTSRVLRKRRDCYMRNSSTLDQYSDDANWHYAKLIGSAPKSNVSDDFVTSSQVCSRPCSPSTSLTINFRLTDIHVGLL
jgi:tetratricopeptide (TPR) repeat protein